MILPISFDLRRRVALLVILTVLPALALTVWVGFRERMLEVERVGTEMKRISRIAAVTHQEVIVGARHLLAALAQMPEVRQRDAAACNAILGQLQRQFPSYAIMLVADAGGQVFADSRSGPRISIADRPYFHRALAVKDFAVGNYAVGRISSRPTLHCAQPVLAEDGSVVAVVVAGIDVSWLGPIADQARLPTGSVLTVLDRDLKILARTVDPERWVGSTAPEVVRPDLLAGEQGAFIGDGPDAVRRIYGYCSLTAHGEVVGKVVVGVPLATAYVGANRALIMNLILVAAVAVSALMVGLWLSRRLIETPLRNLCSATARIAQGEFSVAVPRSGRQGEFAALADSITTMAEALARREADQQVATAALATAHDRLSAIIHAAPVAIIILDQAGRVDRVWNPAAEDLYGWKRAEMLDRVPPMLDPSDDFAALFDRPGEEQVHLGRDGQSVRVAVFAARLGSAAQAAGGVVAIIVDVSETRRLRDELAQAQKMELVGRLAGGVAHDFNNLLAVITGFADLLAAKLPAGSNEREQARQIVGAAERAAELTSRLLTLARRQPHRRIVVDVSARVAGMARLLTQAVSSQCELRLVLATEPCPVLMDPVQIDQVVMNLVVNARDAMPDGGSVALAIAHRGGVIEMVVSDGGAGMSDEARLRLFEPFFTTKGHGLGTGLGLATVKAIVDAAKGSISVESQPGLGTTVRIQWPCAVESSAQPGSGRPGRLPGLVLVVDDEDRLREMMSASFHGTGVQAVTAGDAVTAVARLDAGLVPEAVITDLIMPGMNGIWLAREVRRRFPAMPVLFVTGFADEHTVAEVVAFGERTAMLAKPFTATALHDALVKVAG
jgi:PAS domain S-box-containing protein